MSAASLLFIVYSILSSFYIKVIMTPNHRLTPLPDSIHSQEKPHYLNSPQSPAASPASIVSPS